MGMGSYYLNNQIHQRYRQRTVEDWQKWKLKNKYEPQSVQNIVLGDKVISNRNEIREAWRCCR